MKDSSSKAPNLPSFTLTGANSTRLSLRSNATWTLLGNATYMGCQWGMLVILAKLGSPEKVGILALALAISAPAFMLSNLNLRVVQATDVAEEHGFSDYMALRLFSTLLALAAIIAISVCSMYSFETAMVVTLIGIAKAFESISDMIYGLAQRYERMDLISRSMILKGFASVLAFGGIFALTGSLIGAAAGLACAWFVVLGTYDFALMRRFGWKVPNLASLRILPNRRFRNLLGLIKISLPLGLTMMLISLNTNIPRYFIEHFAGTRALGFFAAIAYLMVAGNLVINALAQAALPRLATYYAGMRLTNFRSLLILLSTIAGILGAFGVLVALIAGRQVLSLMYRHDYAGYSTVFACLMASAGIGYLASMVGCGMAAARLFSPQLPLNLAVAAVCAVASWFWVPAHGLQGAAWALLAAACAQLILNVFVMLRAFRQMQEPAFWCARESQTEG